MHIRNAVIKIMEGLRVSISDLKDYFRQEYNEVPILVAVIVFLTGPLLKLLTTIVAVLKVVLEILKLVFKKEKGKK
jgi:hypothetical protein